MSIRELPDGEGAATMWFVGISAARGGRSRSHGTRISAPRLVLICAGTRPDDAARTALLAAAWRARTSALAAARLARAGQSAAAIVEAIERVGALDERIAQQDADIAARIAGRWPRE